MKKGIISLLVILVLVAVLILAVNAMKEPVKSDAVAYSLTKKQMLERHHIEQIFDYTAENILVYRNNDNTKTVYIFSAPVENSNNELAISENGNYIGTGTYTSKLLPRSLSSAEGIEIASGMNYINVYPVDDEKYASEKNKITNAFGQEKSDVVYKDMFGKGIDFTCCLTSFGINSEIILSKYTGKNIFKIKIKIPDLIPDTGSPDYILFKTAFEKGEVRSILYTSLVTDANGMWSYANTVKLIEKDRTTNTYTVEYTVDTAFLANKNTKYPVKINQSIHIYKSKQPDTSAYEKTGDEAGHYLSPYMLLGDKTIKGEGWTFVRFETLNNLEINADKVVSAKYVFHNLFDRPNEVRIGAYAVTADWCSINTRWFNRPPFDANPIYSAAVKKKGDYNLDITALAKEMLKNKGVKDAKYSVQNSFMIRCDTPGGNIILPSGDNGLFSPYLEIVLKE